jgi:hypothetical protein
MNNVRLTVVAGLLAVLAGRAGRTPNLVAYAMPQASDLTPEFQGRVVEDSSNIPLASAEVRVHRAGMCELAADPAPSR